MAKNQTFGVILMDANGVKTDDDIQFLMTQRRNTYAFGDFVQGRYVGANNNITMENLARIFNYMTLPEKKAIRTNNFAVIWYMYWNTIPATSPSSLSEKIKFAEAESIFTQLIASDNGAKIASMIDQSRSISCIDMFEFPKGRRGSNESGRLAAERELVEETNFNRNFYAMFKDAAPFVHQFTGKDNGQKYTVNYYIGEIIVPRHRAAVSMQRWRQLMEVTEVRLFSLRVIRELFPHYTAACMYAIAQYKHMLETTVKLDMSPCEAPMIIGSATASSP